MDDKKTVDSMLTVFHLFASFPATRLPLEQVALSLGDCDEVRAFKLIETMKARHLIFYSKGKTASFNNYGVTGYGYDIWEQLRGPNRSVWARRPDYE